jgi:hypothetical protein
MAIGKWFIPVDVRVIPQPNVQLIHHRAPGSCLLHGSFFRPSTLPDDPSLTGNTVGGPGPFPLRGR